MTASIAQRDLFTRRYRKVRALEPSELQIQIAVIAQLRLRCRREILYWHTPNGELRDKRHAAKLKAMGTLPGVSDLIFVFPNAAPLLCLELKAPRRGLTDDQKVFCALMRAAGHAYEWCDSVPEAERILHKYHVFR
jgi:hypothetical protein